MGWDCYGIEPLVMPSIYARGKHGLNVITDTLHDDTFPPEFFDVITSFQVFEHLIRPDDEIHRIRHILKRRGLVVVEVPIIDTYVGNLLGSRNRHFVEDHVSFFSVHTLCQLLQNAGFTIINIEYPARYMSLRHLIGWLGKYGKMFRSFLNMPERVLNKRLYVNIRDIVCVFAQK